MTLAYPEYQVTTTKVNGVDINTTAVDSLKALSQVTISGEVQDLQGQIMSDFNGTVYPVIYDKLLTLETRANDEESIVNSFNLYKNIIFKGKANVQNGQFSFSFIVPKDINYSFGKGRISYYAENQQIDATGFTEEVIIGGIVDNPEDDNRGPNIDVFMNDENFVFGGLVNNSPVLVMKLQDDNGINTVGNGIGHDITAKFEDATNTIVLNEYYKADLNSFKSGEVKYPLFDLEPGLYGITVKAWDVYNNSNDAYTEFLVAESAELALQNVLNYPNPFTTKTNFWFEHNRAIGEPLMVHIQIMTMSGRVIKTIREEVIVTGSRVDHLEWDGLDEFGNKIGRGAYIYKLHVKAPDNTSQQVIEKLVILK